MADQGPFRLLVSALVALALLAVFYTYVVPLFFPSPEPLSILEKNIGVASITTGKGIVKEIRFGVSGFSGNTFDSHNISLAFECNSAALCCNISEVDENCTKDIAWNERSIEIKSEMVIETTARCFYENTIHVCKIYFGKKPAQIEIVKSDIKKKINLDEENVVLDLEIKNSGAVPLFNGIIKVDVYEMYLEANKWEKRYVGRALVNKTFGEIQPGSMLKKQIPISVSGAGKYDVKLRVWGDNAGFEEKNLNFEVTGESTCKLDSLKQCDPAEMGISGCRAICYCTSCLLSSQCIERVRTEVKSIQAEGQEKQVNLESHGITPMATNMVEVSLPQDFCNTP
ncbi:MAG: hypothetical protein QGI60_04150 [archaeon]|jgi:hypothetical protein|nr:hypothetical protein [archaeon]